MASESADDRSITVELPEDLDDWLDGRAEALDVDRRDLLIELVSAYRMTAGRTDDPAEAGNWLSRAVVRDVDERIRQRFEAMQEHFDDDLEAIRRRVIQVKRETDEKAPADHGHGAIADLKDDLAAIEDSLSALEDEVTALSADRPEDRDGEVEDRLANLEERLTLVARSVLSLRSDFGSNGAAPAAPDEPLTRIKRMAGRSDIRTAKCGDCGGTVRVGLLPEASCPHCRAELADLQEASGFFASAVLTAHGTEDADE